jgi:hypothetical protein
LKRDAVSRRGVPTAAGCRPGTVVGTGVYDVFAAEPAAFTRLFLSVRSV